MKLTDTFLEHFTDIPDFRLQNHNFRHKLGTRPIGAKKQHKDKE